MRTSGSLLLLAALFLSVSCHKPAGQLCVDFSFAVDGEPMQQDELRYVNAAGNRYSVTEAQYFISHLTLTKSDGTSLEVRSDKAAHYVDADIASTLTWLPTDEIPAGRYTEVSFTFGLAPDLNVSYAYPDAPENAMSWPANLGGGYHYMKINGWWQAADGTQKPFNLHTGIGQLRDAEGNITGFMDNTFTVTLPLDNFVIQKGEVSSLQLQMDINQWFTNPHIFDWEVFGGSIMQNQEAQEVLRDNGKSVFSLKD